LTAEHGRLIEKAVNQGYAFTPEMEDEWLAVGSEMGRLLRDIKELLSSR